MSHPEVLVEGEQIPSMCSINMKLRNPQRGQVERLIPPKTLV